MFIFILKRVDKLKETVNDNKPESLFCKTPALSNPENYVLTHNCFNIYMILVFNDLNKAQIYKMQYRDSPHHEIERLMSFNYLTLFKPNEHT